ncbi:hypothetical protein Nepgr_011117 [Nepenthes gracilis]|uniref:Casein kinase II subunit beta n=1 Tax=Nepenthes gracilis TaxID=150966 RepID=A0AAD3SEH0_NEPGR|nr:hypothetical protein Nepgr_011117 [Nepenthes gracilis]
MFYQKFRSSGTIADLRIFRQALPSNEAANEVCNHGMTVVSIPIPKLNWGSTDRRLPSLDFSSDGIDRKRLPLNPLMLVYVGLKMEMGEKPSERRQEQERKKRRRDGLAIDLLFSLLTLRPSTHLKHYPLSLQISSSTPSLSFFTLETLNFEEEMYRRRGSMAETATVDRKRINEALDKHLERSSPSTSKSLNGKDKDRLSAQSIISSGSGGKQASDRKDSRSASLSENRCSDDESETDSEESDVSGSDGDDTSWISWFCNLRGNEFFCEVDADYIQDDFNLCGLSIQVPYYDYALDLILDIESSHCDMFTEEQNELVESAAEMLYGLVHAQYILTSKGMAAMFEKYKTYDFGRCPRVCCCSQPCLPVGQSDIPRSSTVKIYCPKCEDIYYPRSKYQGDIDCAYFGTTFPHLFLMTYPQLKPQKPSQRYVPRVFGFKIHKP